MTVNYTGIWHFRLPQRDGYFAGWSAWFGPWLIAWGDPSVSDTLPEKPDDR